MSPFVCPFCGPRELGEFQFRKTVATVDGPSIASVYLRIEQPGRSKEHWQHVAGCRAWLAVERNPQIGAILSIQLLADNSP